MNTAVFLLRLIHIAAGCIALATFAIPLITRKGSRIHRKVGLVYVYAMFVASAMAIGIAPLRLLQRPTARWGGPLFLAFVALLSFASAFYGLRVLQQKKRNGPHTGTVDFVVTGTLLASSVAIGIYGFLSGFQLAVMFAPLGLLVAVPQLQRMRRTPTERNWWLIDHLGAMMVSCIGTLTAFLVTNVRFITGSPMGAWLWLVPTAVMVPLMIVWQRSYKKSG